MLHATFTTYNTLTSEIGKFSNLTGQTGSPTQNEASWLIGVSYVLIFQLKMISPC